MENIIIGKEIKFHKDGAGSLVSRGTIIAENRDSVTVLLANGSTYELLKSKIKSL